MPLLAAIPSIVMWGTGGVFVLLGLKQTEKVADASTRLVWSAVAAGGVYLVGKKLKAW